MSSYQACNIKRNLIQPIITEFVGTDADVNTTTANDRITYSIKFTNNSAKTALLLVYYRNDGTTTLNYGSGKNQVYSKKIADVIIEKASIVLVDVKSLYFNKLDTDSFVELKKLLVNDGLNVSEPNILTTGKQYHITSENGEVLHLIYYNNFAIHFQGRPSIVFNKAIEKLLDIFPSKDVVKELLGYYNITIPKEDFEQELKTIYPNLYNGIDEKMRAIILPSIALKRVIVEGLDDYSYIAYPALRGIEGVLKSIFQKNGIIIENKTGFGGYFKFNYTKQIWEAEESTSQIITNSDTCNKLSNMYTVYNNIRHSLFHVDTLAPKLTIKQDAISIVEEVLNIIDANHVNL